MDHELSLPHRPSSLGRRLALVGIRERGVSREQLHWIATDSEIFEAFYREHVEAIQQFVARRVGDRERAADLTAEIFLAAIDAAHRYRPSRATPRAWLYGIARTVVANDWRRTGREKARDARLRASTLLDEDDVVRIEARIEAAAMLRRLYEAMDRLSEAERTILELVAIDELSLTEAAAAAGVRPVTARVRLHRARRKLRAELEDSFNRTNRQRGGPTVKENRDNFEEKLLYELKTVVAQRGAEEESAVQSAAPPPRRRRAPRIAMGAAVGLATAAAVFVFNSGGSNTSKAFAVESAGGDGVTIKVYSPEDATGLEGALADAGIRSQVTWLPAGETCREPRFTPSTAKTSLGGTISRLAVGGPAPALTIGIMTAQESSERSQEFEIGEISEDEYHSSTANISIDPEGFRPDQTVVIAGSPGSYDGNPEGGFEAQVAVAEGPVGPCEPVKAPDGVLSEINRARKAEATQGKADSNSAGKTGSAPSPAAE